VSEKPAKNLLWIFSPLLYQLSYPAGMGAIFNSASLSEAS